MKLVTYKSNNGGPAFAGAIWLLTETRYSEREIPKNAGFRWSGEGKNGLPPKCWYTDNPTFAKALVEYADAETAMGLAGIPAAPKVMTLEERVRRLEALVGELQAKLEAK